MEFLNNFICALYFSLCVLIGVQDTEDDAHDETEYGSEEPLREQVNTFYLI